MSTNLELKLNDRVEEIQSPAIDIRYGQVGLVQVRIRTTDPGAILDELTGRVAAAPHFFQRAGVYLDLNALQTPADAAQLRGAIDAIRRAGMLTVGLAAALPPNGCVADVEELGRTLQLPVLSNFRASGHVVVTAAPIVQPVPVAAPANANDAAEPAAAPTASSALIHTQTVRSGQRIYARGRDLVLTASVGAGAEVMADGCLHIYGALRGRAMAGTHGDAAARVFCHEFYAELVSIAGVFRVFETIPPELAGKPVQVRLDGEHLRFDRLGS